MILRPLQPSDYPEVAMIYLQGMKSGLATFETEVPDYETFHQKFHPFCRYVAVMEESVAGWAVLSAVSPRKCYQGVAEVSLYVHQSFQRKGVGMALLEMLKQNASSYGIWTLQATIFEKNLVSIHLHRKAGFREVGYRERIAQRDGEWLNTRLLELRLDDPPVKG